MRHYCMPYVVIGGGVFVAYQMVYDYIRHHYEHNNDRPLFLDHTIACGLIGSLTLGTYLGRPRHFFTGGWLGAMFIGPMMWWFKSQGII